jgi:hypothetical protein
MQWSYRTGWVTVTAWLLLTWLRRASCEMFVIHLNATTNVTLDVHLGDKVTVICPLDRYDNILYLRTRDQLIHCNASALPASYTAADLDPYIDVGGCSGSSGPSFDIDIKRTPAFLETTVPFRKGDTFYFTSFTDGTAFSAAAKPTAGGDCTRGLSLVFNVIDPDQTPSPPSVKSAVSATAPTPVPTTAPRPVVDVSGNSPELLALSGSQTILSPMSQVFVCLLSISLFITS